MLEHVAIKVSNIEEFLDFFAYVFGYKITETRIDPDGTKKVWIDGGIQFNESPDIIKKADTLDHIALSVKAEDYKDIIRKAYEKGCYSLPAGENWLMMKQGFCLEILKK